MTIQSTTSSNPRVLVVGGGVAALECALALSDLAGDLTDVSVLAPNTEFVYRPMTVREPFALPAARRYPIAPIVGDAGAQLIADELAWVDPTRSVVHTAGGQEIGYDVLVLALGAHIRARYAHAITIDDRALDEALHGLIQDIEGGYVKSVAFVAPGRMAWPLPLYEIALMTAGRAYDMNVEMTATIVTPEDSPLAIFGAAASEGVAKALRDARIETINSAYAEVRRAGEIVINPGDRRLEVDRIVALPELYGPSVRGVEVSEHGFLRVDASCRLLEHERIFAAGDATEFAVKQGGIASQQADTIAQSIAAMAGAPVTVEPFQPVLRGMLLTGDKPLYLAARITGGQGFSSEISEQPLWSPPSKISARYLAPYLDGQDRARSPA
jgi:sulfide:quinone oxidoreductase